MPSRKGQLHRRERRHHEALERQAYWDKLSLEQRLEALDNRLGNGHGAAKQRARITTQMEERDKPCPKKKSKK